MGKYRYFQRFNGKLGVVANVNKRATVAKRRFHPFSRDARMIREAASRALHKRSRRSTDAQDTP